MNRTWRITRAAVEDANEILKLQKLAYQDEAELYSNYDIPPLKQTIDEIKYQFENHIFLKAVSENEIIGTVRAYQEKGTCYISRLAVHPDSRNRGIGTALMKAIEACYNSDRFELFTGSKSNKNIRFYRKLGYTIFKTGKHGCGDVQIYYMEKICRKICRDRTGIFH